MSSLASARAAGPESSEAAYIDWLTIKGQSGAVVDDVRAGMNAVTALG